MYHIAALFTIAKTWKQPKCPLTAAAAAAKSLVMSDSLQPYGP